MGFSIEEKPIKWALALRKNPFLQVRKPAKWALPTTDSGTLFSSNLLFYSHRFYFYPIDFIDLS
jgi:hypothetical protein